METIEARSLGRQYGQRWALTDCTLDVPAGTVTGLVGPNGAGKTTLLNLVTGMLKPTTGSIRVLGGTPASGRDQLRKVGYVAQETPVYAGLSVADHLKMGQHMNARWDAGLAAGRIAQLGLDPRQKAGRLSGGQRAQLALTLAVARRPELLILDEPVASLDPLARREFLASLAGTVAASDMSVVMSSHLVSDLERVCDYLIVLVASRVQVAGPVDDLLAAHRLLTGAGGAGSDHAEAVPAGCEVITRTRTPGQTTLLVRGDVPGSDPAWAVTRPGLEDIVLAYMGRADNRAGDGAVALEGIR